MSVSASTQALTHLEPYLLLAKSAKGAAAAKLIVEATSSTGCFVFSELLQIDGIKALQHDNQYAPTYRLLELFAYGTFRDYQNAAPGTYTQLNPAQLEKLRRLTLVSLASKDRTLSYATLLENLGFEPSPSHVVTPQTMRQLEDVVIEATYSGIISARLDQDRQRVIVESVMGRDVAGQDALEKLSTALVNWQSSAAEMLTTLANRINEKRSIDATKRNKRAQLDAKIHHQLTSLAIANGEKGSNNGINGGGGGGNLFNERDEMDLEDDGNSSAAAAALRKKKSSSGGPTRAKRSRA